MAEVFITVDQVRFPLAAGVWNPVVIPAGARDALVTMDDNTVPWRLSSVILGSLSEGTFVSAPNGITFRGTMAADVTVYIAVPVPTTAQVLFSRESP